MNLFIIFILFLFTALVLGILGIIIYHTALYGVHRFQIKVKYFSPKRLKWVLIFSIISIAFYQSYTSVYPTDDFYIQEFEYVTLQEIPDSAEIKFKQSSYPDFHGDYSSESVIELSKFDYQALMYAIKAEGKLIELDAHTNMHGIIFQRKIPDQADQFLYIQFLDDGKTIKINIDFI